jgi:hypothetical protein
MATVDLMELIITLGNPAGGGGDFSGIWTKNPTGDEENPPPVFGKRAT